MTAGARQTWMVWLLAAVMAGLAWCALVLGFGTFHPLEVTSGRSMFPTLRTGDLVLIRGVSPLDLRVGEIVAFHVPGNDQREYGVPREIVHRIVGLSMQDGTLTVQTQGDSQGPDPFTVPATDVDGTVVAAVPRLGYGFLYLHSRPGLIALAGLAILGLLYFVLTTVTDALMPETAPSVGLGSETAALALAVREYGQHLQSHTRVVMELGGTTEHLRTAAATQNDVLRELRQVVGALAMSGVRGIPASTHLGRPGSGGDVGEPGPAGDASGAAAPDSAGGPDVAEPVRPEAQRGRLAARPVHIGPLLAGSARYPFPEARHREAPTRGPEPERLPSRRQRRGRAPSRSLTDLYMNGAVPESPLPSRHARKRRGLRHA